MGKLILVRHGESIWNKENLFTGWVDVPLSQKGIEESYAVGRQLQDTPIDVIFTSSLCRALMTVLLAMSLHKSGKTPVIQHPGKGLIDEWGKIYNPKAAENTIPIYYGWELNERMYGALQGLNKAETIAKYGAEQVKLWRRSYDTCPPEGESLAMTAARTIPYFQKNIVPYLEKGKTVFVGAHGNSLRAICMILDNLSKEQVVQFEIATGVPIIYDFSKGKFIKKQSC